MEHLPKYQPKLILFDLDGTLVDSVPDLALCVDRTLQDLDMPKRGEAAVRDWVGNGVEQLMRRALSGEMEGEPESKLFEKAYPLFLDYYSRFNGTHSRLYPGVQSGLEQLHQSGYTLGCVTNKADAFTQPLLKRLGIHPLFSLIISGDTLARKKPDPMPLLHACQHFRILPPQGLMVGDSINDVRAARAAGFPVVCVPYGYNHGQDIREAAPDAVIDSIDRLPAMLVDAA